MRWARARASVIQSVSAGRDGSGRWRCRLRDTQPTMPQESTTPDLVERWQKAAEAYARHDLHTAMRFYAPDAVWDGSSAGVGAYFEGAAAIRRFLEDWIGPFEENEYNQEESQDLGNGVL